MTPIKTIVFDLGGVLLDWNPMYVYRDYFESEEQRNFFFEKICTSDWNEEQDAGRSIVEATQLLIAQNPEWEKPIRDFYGRWTEMLQGPIHGTVEIFKQLKESGNYRIYALTNWQADLFNIALVRYNFLHWFDGRVVSGEEKTRKPFLPIYKTLVERFSIVPSDAVYIDDNIRNLHPAKELGFSTIHFQSPEQFRKELEKLGVL